jgi:hypothetical protein
VRSAAPDYVNAFLTLQATPQAVEQLRIRLGSENVQTLEALLRERVALWVAELADDELTRYDVCTVKDLVFAQLRTWC